MFDIIVRSKKLLVIGGYQDKRSWFLALWFYGFIVLGFCDFMVLWFCVFMVLWFYGLMVSWLYGFLASETHRISISCFLTDIDPRSMIWNNFYADLHHCSVPVFSKSGPKFANCGFPKFRDLQK